MSTTGLRNAFAAVVLVTAAALVPAALSVPAARAEGGAHPAQIDRNGTLILIRSTLLALQAANETGNYTVLRDLGAPSFQQANTASRLGEIFANLRTQKIDLSGTCVLDPQLTLLPQIEENGLLHIAGFFPSVPTQINFELLFAAVDGRWKLFGISVKLGSSTPVAPSPPQPSTAPATAPTAKTPPPAKHKHVSKPAEAKPAAITPDSGNP